MINGRLSNAVFCIFGFLVLMNIGQLRAKQTRAPQSRVAIQNTLEDSVLNIKLAKKSPKGAFIRSVAFPGLGQWYNGQKIKAFLAFSVEGFLIGLSIYYNRKAKRSEEGSQLQELWTDRRNSTYWFLLAAALLSGVDAYIDAHLYDFDTGPDLGMRMGVLPVRSPVPGSPTFGLSLVARF